MQCLLPTELQRVIISCIEPKGELWETQFYVQHERSLKIFAEFFKIIFFNLNAVFLTYIIIFYIQAQSLFLSVCLFVCVFCFSFSPWVFWPVCLLASMSQCLFWRCVFMSLFYGQLLTLIILLFSNPGLHTVCLFGTYFGKVGFVHPHPQNVGL